ncbi:Butyrophilin subfamily 3 member A1 [Dissostichus eleginoides]|uniref:Butyrophilin subfamily 3 member A1 n=1 Tax=Dissostichus eleginoides TaxID=100907 RepID=A0AAD9BU70_DISEL|nr:Butyrophilin subfamily 3 member A1 [Dissostichus eleginoides]
MVQAESLVHGSPEKVCVSGGGVVILPCSFPPKDVFPTVEWSKTDLKKGFVLLFRDNREDLVEQSPLYVSRTNLSVEDLKSGNASLRISNVQPADAGMYHCMRMWNNDQQNITKVELVVAVPGPKISVMPLKEGGFTLECEATCWGSDAKINFLDENGKNLTADYPKKGYPRGCFTVQRRVTLQEASNRVTCRVQRADTNETRETKIQLPDFPY